jgi:hypothetical protein
MPSLAGRESREPGAILSVRFALSPAIALDARERLAMFSEVEWLPHEIAWNINFRR